MVGVTVPIIPMAHQYLFTEPIEGVHPGLPQLRDPDNLVYFREEVGGLCMGGYERDPAPWALDGIPADFNGKLLAPDMAALRVDHGGRRPARPGDGRRGRQPGHQRPRGRSRPTTSSSSASPRSRGFFVAAGFSAHGIAGRGRDRAPDGVAGSSTASPSSTCGRWTSGGSGRPIAARRTRWPGRSRTTRPTTTSTTRTRSARPGARCGRRRPTRSSPGSARRSARSPAGSARTGSSRTPPPATRRLRPRGWAGEHWSPAIGAEALATRRAAGLFDETSFAKLEVVGPGAAAFLQRMCANDVDRAGRLDRLHAAAQPPRRDRGRPDGDAAGGRRAT